MPVGDSGGFLLSLLTESFAVRALVGSLAAAALAAVVVRYSGIRSSQARRILLLAPVLTAAIAGVASLRDAEAYLPQLWVASSAGGATGQLFELLGELRAISTEHGVDLLAVAYAAVVAVLVSRRLAGCVAVRRLLGRGSPPAGHPQLVTAVNRLAAGMAIRAPRLVLMPACPGGAFTTGWLHPVVALDTALLAQLDEREVEGLLAHELAHIARRDTLVGTVVGLFRDCTFFLPAVHLAARWLRGEQEESADELASRHTGRPAALASGILKVWDTHCGRHLPTSACAATGARGSLLPVAVGGPALQGPAPNGGARALTIRLERLISLAPAVTLRRRRAEVTVATLVLVAATSAAIAVPAWVATNLNAYSLSFGVLPAPAVPVESPAFATFRGLTSEQEGAALATPSTAATAEPDSVSPCPCLESRAQLEGGVGATETADTRMLWASEGTGAWELPERPSVRARPLWMLSDTGPQVGFFLVARPPA